MSTLHPTWEASGLPADKGVPRSRLSLVPLAGETVLELASKASYGVLRSESTRLNSSH